MNLVEFPAVDAKRMHDAAAAGDADAKMFFAELFPEGGQCFLCDLSTTPAATVAMIVSPDDPSMVLAVPECTRCSALPPLVKSARELKMLRAIWPEGRWKLTSDRNSRGRKVRRA
ncbi:MAG: hypothetical protein WB764_10605 [Xanthobacteraceae bacterium]